ncbi:MAG: PEP-CTERM sorting domain-containing protein [Acidobacteriaceae bacterium]|nr:PEP-CTERM sorting domain-containing protein [Acidobacteriaceae bacterium]
MRFNKNLHLFLLGLAACVGLLASTPVALASTINNSSPFDANGTVIRPMQSGGGSGGSGGSSGTSSSGGSGGGAGASGASTGSGGTNSGGSASGGSGTGSSGAGSGSGGSGTAGTGTGTSGTGTSTGTGASSSQLTVTVNSNVPTQNDYLVYGNRATSTGTTTTTGTGTSGTGTMGTGTSGTGTSGTGTTGTGTTGTGTTGTGTAGTGTTGTGTTGTGATGTGTSSSSAMNAVQIGSLSTNQTKTETLSSGSSSGFVTLIGMAGATNSTTSSGTSSGTQPSTANDVVLAIRSGANTGQTWSTWFGGTSESTIMSDLQTNNTTALEQFASQYSSDFATLSKGSATADLIEFGATSPGTVIGTVSFSSGAAAASGVPEPSTYGLLLAGALGLGALKMRRKASRS